MEKQNLSADEQMRRLGNRWVFDCANQLMADENMERKDAFRQAVRADRRSEPTTCWSCWARAKCGLSI